MQILTMEEVVLNFRAITSRSDDVVGRQFFSFIVIFLLTILVIGCHTRTSVSADPASAKPQVVSDTAVRVSEADLSNWKTYRNKQYGIELKYPETWTVGGEGSGTNEPTGQPAQRTTVWMIGFRKPHRDGEPDVYLTLSIQVNENPRKLTIDDFVAELMRAMKNTSASTGHTTVGREPGVFIDVTSSLGRKQRAIYCLLHETGLLSLLYPTATQFDPTLARMVSSLRFEK